MNHKILIATMLAGAASALAGPMGVPNSSYVPQPIPPTPSYGVGMYFGIQGGLNLYQNYEGTEHGTIGKTDVALEMKEKLGGFGGIKWGYGFDGGVVKPAVELDAFYNGCDFELDARANGKSVANATGRFDTGAFLLNGMLRFDTGSAFMPYVGAGVGGWLGQVDDGRVTLKVRGGKSERVSSDDTNADLAFQGLLGFDYFFGQRWSFFTEYKYLNYFGTNLPTDDPVQQHLLGVGVKFFF